jgi:hypothetical protein
MNILLSALLPDKSTREIMKLNQENETLQVEMCRLQEKLDHWKSKCNRQENQNGIIVKNKMLNRENHNLKQDIEVYKTVIRRLNKEIAFYQEKLRTKYQSSPNKIPVLLSTETSGENSGGEACSTSVVSDLQEPRETLLPLLTAYDEAIDEKNEIIKEHEFMLEKFKLKCQEIVQENEHLHKIIGESQESGSVSINDWKCLRENALLVLEENDVFHDKIEVLQRKAGFVQKMYEEKGNH